MRKNLMIVIKRKREPHHLGLKTREVVSAPGQWCSLYGMFRHPSARAMAVIWNVWINLSSSQCNFLLSSWRLLEWKFEFFSNVRNISLNHIFKATSDDENVVSTLPYMSLGQGHLGCYYQTDYTFAGVCAPNIAVRRQSYWNKENISHCHLTLGAIKQPCAGCRPIQEAQWSQYARTRSNE